MRKEVILAVIIGVLLGGVILYGINLANKSSKSNTNEETKETTSNKVTPTLPKSNNQISIAIPLDHSVVTDASVALKGNAKPNSNIAIVSESDDILTTSDNSGNFQVDINLISGENTITVTVVDDKQATSSSSITVIKVASLPE